MKLKANFVMTVDGKVQGPGAGYWPIGSEADLEQVLKLREESDALIHGRMTALAHQHIKRLSAPRFKNLAYVVVSAHPDEVLLKHIDPAGTHVRVILATTNEADVADTLLGIEVWRLGSEEVDLHGLLGKMEAKGLKTVDLEAGPNLFGAFVKAKLVNELYVTVAPKLFGTSFGTPTMINGVLFEPGEVPRLELMDSRAEGDEIFLHYRFAEPS